MSGSRDGKGDRFFDPFLVVKLIDKMPSREIINPSMNLHVRISDRLNFPDIINLPFHALPHNDGYGPFVFGQPLDKVNERLEPAVDDRTCRNFTRSVGDFDGVFNTPAFRVPNDDCWKTKPCHHCLYLGDECRLTVLYFENIYGIFQDRQRVVIVGRIWL